MSFDITTESRQPLSISLVSFTISSLLTAAILRIWPNCDWFGCKIIVTSTNRSPNDVVGIPQNHSSPLRRLGSLHTMDGPLSEWSLDIPPRPFKARRVSSGDRIRAHATNLHWYQTRRQSDRNHGWILLACTRRQPGGCLPCLS